MFGGVFAAAGAAWRALDGMGIEPWRIAFVRHAFQEFGHSALWITVPLALLAVTALGSAGAVGVYAENWWRYRLEWTDAATLRVRRGLFTTRSVSIERDRLRGVALREPLLLRPAAARPCGRWPAGSATARRTASAVSSCRPRPARRPCGCARASRARPCPTRG
ncbi:hypothetical protein ACFQ2B_20955 [Streptomyces stramineus]